VSLPGKREIYEKTLELNVCCEILAILRAQPGYQKAVWQGLTQAQERQVGLDELVRNLGPGRNLMLQFKAPWSSSPADTRYKFSLNTRQHQTLERGPCTKYPDAVFYVLPLYISWSKVNSFVPNLTRDTWLLRVKDVDSKALGLSQQRHRLEVAKTTLVPTASIFSPEIGTHLLHAEEVFRAADDSLPLRNLIPSETLAEWVESISHTFPPGRFRGLYSLFIPSE
jgi:hypothetical protein